MRLKKRSDMVQEGLGDQIGLSGTSIMEVVFRGLLAACPAPDLAGCLKLLASISRRLSATLQSIGLYIDSQRGSRSK